MFSKSITNPALASNIADDIFPNINGAIYGNDKSFTATLRALLADRINKNEIYTTLRIRCDRKSTIETLSDEEYVKKISEFYKDTIFICGLNDTSEGALLSLKKIENSFLKTYKGFEELKDLRIFVSKQADMLFYINEEMKSAVIFVASINTKLWHLIQSLIPRVIPWFFKDNAINEEERALLKSLTNRYAPEYESLIEKFATKYDFRGKMISKMLLNFEKDSRIRQLNVFKDKVRSLKDRLNSILHDYDCSLTELNDLNLKTVGLEYQIKEGDFGESDLVDYFVCNKHVTPIEAYNNHLKIIASTTIENYDPDMFDRMLKNNKSYLFTGYTVTAPAFVSVDARKKLLDALFGDERCLKLKTCAYFDLNLGGSVSTIQRYNYPAEYISNCLVNPHFYFHACIGNNRSYINKCLMNGDYILAIEQCLSSAQNLNLAEGSQTVAPFMGLLFSSNCNAVILLPDGRTCTPTEAFNWLKETTKENAQEVEK